MSTTTLKIYLKGIIKSAEDTKAELNEILGQSKDEWTKGRLSGLCTGYEMKIELAKTILKDLEEL